MKILCFNHNSALQTHTHTKKKKTNKKKTCGGVSLLNKPSRLELETSAHVRTSTSLKEHIIPK